MGAGILLVSPTGLLRKYVVQLAFPQEGYASSTAECEGLLAGLRIVTGLGVTHLAIRGDSQLMASQAGGTCASPPMKAYMGEMQRL
jgi:ribonuclease HI